MLIVLIFNSFMRVVVFLPAKSDSERISKKNLTILEGEYLFIRQLKNLLNCKEIDEIFLDTDSDDMISMVEHLNISIIKRPKELANNQTDGHKLFAFEVSQVPNADIYVQVLCTAPLLKSSTIDDAILKLKNSQKTSIIAVNLEKHYSWNENNQPNYDNNKIPNSIDLKPTILESMCLYAVKNTGNPILKRYTDNVELFPISKVEAFDINTNEDLEVISKILKGENSKLISELFFLEKFFSTAIISDTMSDILHNQNFMLSSNFKKFVGKKVLGRAKTMEIMEVQGEEDWRDIYKCLDSYKFINNGDIIVVDNKIQHLAYFGDLNAHLAIKAGARGAIINGFTRDLNDVAALDFYISAKGSYSKDIKYYGKLGSINQKITIDGVNISNGDYIMADEGGVCVVPSYLWNQVKNLAIKKIKNEFMIKISMLENLDLSSILNEFGNF
jgi:CMP-N-acetylneuraminic acid synthetase/regulator of RNase E activity RraA